MNEVTAVSVPQGVTEYIKALIRRGELGPGDRLPPERRLAESLGVGRSSLREGIKQLQEDGYITVRRGKHGGNFVSALSRPLAEWRRAMREQAEELEDITTMRLVVESQAASLAASRRTEEDLKAMESAILQEGEAVSLSEYRFADSLFHEAVAKAAGSRRLGIAISQVRSEFFADMLAFPEQIEEDQRQHIAIYKAIKDQDSIESGNAMRRHIEHTRQDLHRLLQEETR